MASGWTGGGVVKLEVAVLLQAARPTSKEGVRPGHAGSRSTRHLEPLHAEVMTSIR